MLEAKFCQVRFHIFIKYYIARLQVSMGYGWITVMMKEAKPLDNTKIESHIRSTTINVEIHQYIIDPNIQIKSKKQRTNTQQFNNQNYKSQPMFKPFPNFSLSTHFSKKSAAI